MGGLISPSKCHSPDDYYKGRLFQSALLKQLKGDLGAFVEQMRTSLVSALAHTEVMIDYSEEDIPSDIITRIHSMLASLATRLNNIHIFSKARPSQGHSLLPYWQAKCRQVILT